MKKLFILSTAVILITCLSGCLATLHPLFTVKDLVYDPRLIGNWNTGTNDNDIAIFEQGSTKTFKELPEELQQVAHKAYLLTLRNKESDQVFKYYVFLVQLGDQLFFDYYPAENKWQKGYDVFYKQHQVRMHSFYRVQFKNDRSFQLSEFDQGFLNDLIDNKKISIQHEVRFDGGYVITAPTEVLQQYVLKYSNVPEAYNNQTNDTYYKIQ